MKKTTLLILALAVVAVSAFGAGGIAHFYGIHHKIPGVDYVASRIWGEPEESGQSEEPFFYPAPKQVKSEIFRKETGYPFTFIVYGDSREPAGYQKHSLITQVTKENPSFVVHTGDMVCYGEEYQWQIFDLCEGRIIDAGIPLYPALGNHEYHTTQEPYPPDPRTQLQHYFDRFKFLGSKRWYSFTYGNCRFLVLDTNTDFSPRSEQYNWFISELSAEAPGFLFIAFHHPPYSGVMSREAERQLANIIESYGEERLIKADVVFSGHVHNYQRFRRNGVNYVVSGGGGAPPHLVDERLPDDFFRGQGPTWHYCRITVSESEAIFQMIHLDKDTMRWEIGDTFRIMSDNIVHNGTSS